MDDWDFSGAVDDLASMWSPSNLRTSDFLSNVDFSTPDLSSLWSPSNLRASDFLSNVDIPFSLPDVSSILTNVSDILPGVSDILGPSGRPRDTILNQDNPLVQTFREDLALGNVNIPELPSSLGNAVTGASYSPDKFYGLTNPDLSESARSGLYENVSFATASGASEFGKRLAGESGDVIRIRNPENNSKYFEATPIKGPDGKVLRDSNGKPMVNVVEKNVGPGTGVIGEGEKIPSSGSPVKPATPQQGAAKTGTTGGVNPLGVAGGLAALGALTGMFGGNRPGQNVPNMPTVRNIQPITTAPVTVQRPVDIMPGANDPRILAQRLGAPMMMAHGGLSRYARGGGSGQDDKIPAYLSDGEYVIDAATVSDLGDGSNEHGARVLDQFRKNIRQHKRSASADQIPPRAKSPLQYLKG